MEVNSNISFIWILVLVVLSELIFDGDGRASYPRIRSYGKIYKRADIFKSDDNISLTPSEVMETSSQQPSNCRPVSWSTENCLVGPVQVNKDISTSVFQQLCPKPRGKFEAPTSCDLYIVCHDDLLTINRCPPTFHFNPFDQACVAPSLFACSHAVTDPESILNQSLSTFPIGGNLEKDGNDLPAVEKNLLADTSINEFEEEDLNPVNEETEEIDTKLTFAPRAGSVEEGEWSQKDPVVDSIRKSRYGNGYPGAKVFFEQRQTDCSQVEGIFPHPNSCEMFIQCAAGNQYIQRCSPGTVFNPDLSICDWARNVPQCNNFRTKRSLRSSVQDLLHPNTALSKRIERLHTVSKRSMSSRRTSEARNTPCSEDYIRPHLELCNKFEICSNGRIFEETCGLGTLFDPLNLVCNFPDKVDCQSRKADLGTYGCQKDNSYITSHWEFCNKFIECDKGVLVVKSCPPDLVYNAETSSCDYAFKIKCTKPISLEHDIDVNYIRDGRSVLNYACEFNYIAPHPQCNKFVECEDGRLYTKSCGPGTVYNLDLGQCDWAYNTRKPEQGNCRRYLECQGGEWRPKSCTQDYLFNPVTKKCDRPEKVECQRFEILNVVPAS